MDELLFEVERTVKKETGYEIKLVEKPMEEKWTPETESEDTDKVNEEMKTYVKETLGDTIDEIQKITRDDGEVELRARMTDASYFYGSFKKCENGLYSDKKCATFRQIQPEDYIQDTTGYDYVNGVTGIEAEVWNVLKQILPNERVRDYMLQQMSYALDGKKPNTIFMILTGSGSNGKSILLTLMEMTVGIFADKGQVTLMTRKRGDPNQASPELVKYRTKRFVFLSEPEDGEKLNIGLLKELTGENPSNPNE
ncbi:hypothetical protein DFJ73DRAFT_764177 [Zopfochytrium polystomum]|nr:hypothetical protein DFJ73DRAFT_764177 [Zopfochytrium polystomum]